MTASRPEPTMTAETGAAVPDVELSDGLKDEEREGQGFTGFPDTEISHVNGWRLHLSTLSLLVLVFLVQMESSIASTTLLSITDQFGGYAESSWVFTAYMLTYCGFQMIWAKWSDITGRRFALLVCLVIFTISSALCGASQSLLHLIQFRWIQGIGACGIFAMAQVSLFELYPPRLWPAYMSIFTAVITLAVIAGPLLGGAITEDGTWRWIFLLNVPVCVVFLPIIYFIFPRRLGSGAFAGSRKEGFAHIISPTSLRKVDLLGSITLLGASILLSAGFQEAELGLSWRSGVVLSLILCSIPLIAVFLIWEWFVTTRCEYPEPVFPWRFLQSRIRIGMIINTFLVGAVLYVCTVQIPQRFMTVHGLSPFAAATKLLSFGVLVAGGSSIAAALMGKLKIPPCWVILFGAILQVIGLVLLTRINDSSKIDKTQYGYQVITGLGVGFINAALTLLVPYVMHRKDLATGTAAISQFRMLGGLIGLSIAASLSTPHVRAQLLQVLPPANVKHLLEKTEAINSLDKNTMERVRDIFSEGYSLQTKMLVGFAVAQIPTTLLMWTNQVAEPGKLQP
ncbi:MFS general substrate transporter [Karstenula rhodostoma CBS 690.94]|uniref:MFS general substrate transporter n=1 Tax=Karstenula rhodostoma CBS 690.94 TaxID=1392251 RepID=A0A9P4PF30_9PLEO|nr:MFS general substrate transporter [Karstenula rhodostoma CBS 690.94]